MRATIIGIGLVLLAGCYCHECQTKSEKPTTSAAQSDSSPCDGKCCALPSRASLTDAEDPIALKTVKFDAFTKDVARHKGKVVLAYQWTNASAASKKNLPILLELQRKHKDAVVLLTVSNDLEKATKDVLKTLQDGKCAACNYRQDEKDVVDGWASCFGCCGFPSLVVFGRDGKRAASFEVTEMPFDPAAIEKSLAKLLEVK
jgi:hypothetical protein